MQFERGGGSLLSARLAAVLLALWFLFVVADDRFYGAPSVIFNEHPALLWSWRGTSRIIAAITPLNNGPPEKLEANITKYQQISPNISKYHLFL